MESCRWSWKFLSSHKRSPGRQYYTRCRIGPHGDSHFLAQVLMHTILFRKKRLIHSNLWDVSQGTEWCLEARTINLLNNCKWCGKFSWRQIYSVTIIMWRGIMFHSIQNTWSNKSLLLKLSVSSPVDDSFAIFLISHYGHDIKQITWTLWHQAYQTWHMSTVSMIPYKTSWYMIFRFNN